MVLLDWLIVIGYCVIVTLVGLLLVKKGKGG